MSKTVKLSKESVEILRSVSQVNNSIRFTEGSTVRTVSADESTIMIADIAEVFPQTFNIFDLSTFLNILTMPVMKDAELVFDDDKKVIIQAGRTKVRYYFSAPNFVMYPEGKTVELPSSDLSLRMGENDMGQLVKSAPLLGHKMLEIRVRGGQVYLAATTPEVETSNDVEICVGDASGVQDVVYSIRIERLNLLPGDYDVTVSASGLVEFKHTTRPVTVFVGLERS